MALTAAVSKEDHEYEVSKVKIPGFGFYFQIALYLKLRGFGERYKNSSGINY